MRSKPNEFQDSPNVTSEIVGSFFADLEAEEFNRTGESVLLDEVKSRFFDDTSPRLYLLGRSGAGKSSLINALSSGKPAETGSVAPETRISRSYEIMLQGQETPWEIIDSRGLFETTPADDGSEKNTVSLLKADLVEYNPDLLVHVITPDQLRAGGDDFKTVERLHETAIGGLPPRVVCLNKVDTYLGPTDNHWPPTGTGPASDRILEALQLIPEVLSTNITEPYSIEEPHRGVLFDSTAVIGAFPLFLREEPYWNISTLGNLLATTLSGSRFMQFAREQRRERLLRRLSRKQTAVIVESVRNLPAFDSETPTDITGLQMFLVGIIGALSGEELSVDTVDEYFDDVSMISHLTIKNTIFKYIDEIVDRLPRKLDLAGSFTRGIGLSAEAYYFDGQVVSPRTARREMEGSLDTGQ